jgi:crotonobetainyl-CoA:carnitine CoA-transferase CaiB-like acyl-CoA transferase
MSELTGERGALDGLRVVEIGGTLASRMLAKLLTDQGAAVTCLRLAGSLGPAAGLGARRWDDGVTAREVRVGPDDGSDEFTGLVRQAGVLVDASDGALEAAGFGFGELTALVPGLIVCRIPSFPSPSGQASEPDGEWAVAAALGLDRFGPGEPAVEPLPMASTYAAILSGMYIIAGLLRRDDGAGAMELEVSLFGAGVMVLDRRLVSVADPGCADPLGQWRLPVAERYECADGRYLQCQGASPGVAAAVLAALGHPEWTAEALRGITALPSAEDEKRWRARFAAAFKQRTAAEWEERIARHGGAGAICRTQQEWADEPHAAAAQIVLAGEPGGSRRAGPAVRVLPASSASAASAASQAADAGHRSPRRQDSGPDDGQAPLPLAGIRVVDLSIILAGPTCGRLLGELGADVVKVDPPGRATVPYVSPWGWLDVNRSKRSVLLDLGQPGACEVLWRLIEDADVLVENFRAGKLEALGFGPEAVFARNPRIVYTSLNAYDFGGDFTRRAGWEQNAQAVSGMQVARSPDGLPRQVPVPVNDYGTGLLGAFGTLVALRAARRTGQGRRVLGSLARTATFLQAPELFWDARGDSGPEPVHLPGTVDFVRCADGWVAVLRPEGSVSPTAARPGQDCVSVLAALREAGVSCLRAVTLADLRSEPRLWDYGYLKTWQHPAWGEMTNVFAHGSSSGFRQRDGWPAPDPGADGGQILASLGYGADQIAALRDCGALGAPAPLFPRATSRGNRQSSPQGAR